ncbi:MAG: transaldolase [Pleurocapsa sp. SU_5_0]|nr:transaldolase [Pleurocapsa sp. SU_5_0]NJO95998.1 transaldolase [Pleurocapsa sp. CRU_1_2]NJR46801.1 transaldolase [Hyellaceae cyanobacterium CSU_1_1]
MSTTNPILAIENQYGQSIWMDNLSRDLIKSGELKQSVAEKGIRGITSNPAIFEKAIAGNKTYDPAIEAGIKANKSVQEIYEDLIFTDIRNACDILMPIYESSDGLDGYVSIEVPPSLAKSTDNSTIEEARRYYQIIDRPNLMIKIPGTPEGLPAIEQAISEGMSINVTLLFSVQSYIETAWAYIKGLEKRAESGADISKVASVASFFLSRIDVMIDEQLDSKLESAEGDAKTKLEAIKGKVAIANAKIAYQEYKEIFSSDRWKALAAKGAKVQRLLWASTGTKNPDYSDVMYVDELVGQDTVNTLPPDTIDACVDHCDPASRIESNLDAAHQVLDGLKDDAVNIDLDAVMDALLEEGIDKFIKPFESLMSSLEAKVEHLAAA